jgi:hypothetical protein
MNETPQQSGTASTPKPRLHLRFFFFFGNPFIPLCLLIASILASTAGILAGRWTLTLFGIALAIAAIGFLALLLLMGLETLNGWASRILSGITELHDTEVGRLAASQTPFSGLKLGSIFRN